MKTMKTLLLTFSIGCFASLTTLPANAGAICRALEATITIAPDLTCKILDHKAKLFPGATFLAELASPPPIPCFSGTLQGTLDGIPIKGTSVSGLTTTSIELLGQPNTGNPDFPIFLGLAGVYASEGWQTFTDNSVITIETLAGKTVGWLALQNNGLVRITEYGEFLVKESFVPTKGIYKLMPVIYGELIADGNETTGAPVKGKICFLRP